MSQVSASSGDSTSEQDLQALETFVLDGGDLSVLEQRISQFNVFEALGIVNQEIRHSNFLKWLLDPEQTHGLGAHFLMAFLLHSLSRGRQLGMRVLSPVRVYGLDLQGTHLGREIENIDILAVNDLEKIVIVVENKIEAGEHGDQLARYAQNVQTQYPGYEPIFIFVSPEPPSGLDERYIPVGYDEIVVLVDRLLTEKEDRFAEPIRLVLSHYRDLLRRHIVPEADIAELCRKIYRKHARALDLIFEYRPDLQSDIATLLRDLIKARDDLLPDHSTKSLVRFAPKSWEPVFGGRGSGWTPTGRLVLFEFNNIPEGLRLKLIIGPGEPSTRAKFFELAHAKREVFNSAARLYDRWTTIASYRFLDQGHLDTGDWEVISKQIEKRWSDFLEGQLPKIDQVVRELEG